MPTPLREALSRPFDSARWRELLAEIFPGSVQLERTPRTHPVPTDRIRSCREFGRVQLSDDRGLVLLEIEVGNNLDLLRNRVELRNLVARFIDQDRAHGVLALIRSAATGQPEYRLTFAARAAGFDATAETFVTRETATRRFTYVLGPGETRRTAGDRLAVLAAKAGAATLEDVIAAFDVEPVSKEFFARYKEHYAAFCRHLLESDAPARVFGLTLDGLEGKALDRALKPVRDFVKKLLGRLVFLHFLQKKGWLGCDATRTDWHGGAPDFLRQLFDSTPAAEKDRFHSTRLVPLFFDTLNDPHRAGDLFAVTGTRVPYLNGGLFERDFAGVEQLDFPAPLFAALLEFFGQYHFTIDENDPEDHEIGIDPEMLGHIFENLLEDNKDKGAYYTPKAVVQYMCQQSLIHALAGHFPDDPAARGEIERLIRTKEPIDARDAQSWLARQATPLATLLDELRICDPAIGSGAFPIGLLQEIYWTKLALNPSLDRARAKRDIIQRSIHGVDLDAGAVEIARLRFWLALIVEESAPVPLPNLDYQIMQGNSLLESFEGERLDDLAEPARFGIRRLGSAQDEFDLASISLAPAEFVEVTTPPQFALAELRQRYYACHEPEEKARLRGQIDTAMLHAIDARLERRRDELETSLAQEAAFTRGRQRTAREVKQRAAMQAELATLDGKKTKLHALLADPRAERPFFLWHLWFRHVLAAPPEGKSGFDIVIANPPYVRQEAIKDLKPVLKKEGYECYGGTADLYVYFYEQAMRVLRPGGMFCFISSNSILNSDFGLTLRRYLLSGSRLTHVLDFAEAPVFNAVTEPVIIGAMKGSPQNGNVVSVLKWNENWPIQNIAEQVAAHGSDMLQSGLSQEVWRLESPAVLALLAKLRRGRQPLGQVVGERFYYGIKSGFNEAYFIDRARRDLLVAEHASSAQLIQPFYRGKDIRKWEPDFSESYLIRIESSANRNHPWSGRSPAEAEQIFAREFPAVHRWLNGFRQQLIKRDDQGTYFWELRSCVYWHEFAEPKIVYQEINRTDVFAFDERGYLANAKVFILPGASKFILALLNSRVGAWFLHTFSGVPFGGFLALQTPIMSAFPIPPASASGQATLSALVDRILAAKRAGDEATVAELEAEIDTHVFRLYGLTPEEISLIQNAAS